MGSLGGRCSEKSQPHEMSGFTIRQTLTKTSLPTVRRRPSRKLPFGL